MIVNINVGVFIILAIISQYILRIIIAVRQDIKSLKKSDIVLSIPADIRLPKAIYTSAFLGAFIVTANPIVPRTQVKICIIKSIL